MTTPTPPTSQALIEALALNLRLSQELLVALHEEASSLRAMDSPGLFRLSRQKDTLLAKLHYLDDAMKAQTSAKDQAPEGISPEQALVIRQYKGKINALRGEILAQNLINKRFTEDTLGYLHDAISLITRPPEFSNTYHIPGRSQARGRSLPNFISREA